MPHAVFGIDELLGLVIDELVETSQPAAVSFAVTCRSFEEPTLRSLWKQQTSLADLVVVLPNYTWVENEYGIEAIVAIEDDPSAEDWSRLQRYASWMRELHLSSDDGATADTLQRLSSNSPGGILCPRLERLYWDIGGTDSTLSFFRLFLSPNLKEVALYTDPFLVPVSPNLPTDVIQIISFLPTSLEDVLFECRHMDDEALVDAMSSFACRCGPSLRSFSAWLPLSEAATQHVIQLPNLCSWTVAHGPPRTIPTPILPSLEELQLDNPEALPWLHLLASHQDGILRDASIRESLKYITCPGDTIVDPTLLSFMVTFRNMVVLRIQAYCPEAEGCLFRLTDNDMEKFAAALPRLEILELGRPCRSNSCSNTVASLLPISVRCLDLTVLEIHFNTKTIVADMQRLLNRAAGSDKAKCKLSHLKVGNLPLEVRREDIEIVAMGFKVIFPSLEVAGDYGCWRALRSKLGD